MTTIRSSESSPYPANMEADVVSPSDLIKRWRGDEESQQEPRMYLQEYDQRWDCPKLKPMFGQALNDPRL
jgi:hypothetical protein